MPKRTMQFSFDVQTTHNFLASAVAQVIVTTPLMPVRPGDRVRAQHLEVYADDASRKLQVFGSVGCGMSFYDNAGNLIDAMNLASYNPTTPDATVVPVDGMDVPAEDPHFLEMAAMNFSSGVHPSQVAMFGSAAVKNSDGAAAHVLTLGVLGVIEIETEV